MFVARRRQFVERIMDPGAFRRPIGDVETRLVLADHFQFVRKRRVERQLHLVNRDAFGRQRDRLAHAFFPVVPILADHAGDQVDIDLIEAADRGPIRRRGKSHLRDAPGH